MDKFKIQKNLLALSVAAILSACGGGSDDDDGPDTITGVQLDGTAAKGIVINGAVTAQELDSAGNPLRPVGAATTDSAGHYTLVLDDNYEGGPIKVDVTNNATTTMVCDAPTGCGTRTDDVTDDVEPTVINFGEQYKPVSLNMSALLPEAAANAAIDVQITPFTHMAAERALAATTLDASAINNANSEVSQLLGGIDILTTEPVDITDPASLQAASANAVAYAALGASLAELAPDDSDGQPDIDAALTTLADDFVDGTISASAFGDIVDQASVALDEVGAMDTSGILNELETVVAAAGDGDIDPEPSTSAGDTNVAKAKAFVADLTTWGVTIGGELDSPSSAFDMQLDMTERAGDMIQNDGAGEAIGLGAMAIFSFFADEISELSQFVGEDGVSTPFSAGTLAKTTSADGDEISLTGGVVSVNGEDVNIDMTLLVPADGSSGTVFTFSIVGLTSESAYSKLVVDSGAIAVTLGESYTIDYAGLDAGTAAEPSNLVSIDLDFAVSLTQKMTVTAEGVLTEAADPVVFAGNLETVIYPYSDSNGEILDVLPGSFTASGSISNSADSYDIALTASIPSAATLEPVNGDLVLGSSYADNNVGEHLISWAFTTHTFTYVHPYNGFVATHAGDNSVTIVYDYGFEQVYQGYASIQLFMAENSFLIDDYSYSFWVEGQGEYVRQDFTAPDSTVDGFIALYLDEVDVVFFDMTQPLIGSLGVQFTAQFEGLPVVNVSITGDVTAFEQGNATATISYDSRMLEFVASNDTTAGEMLSLEITNQDGVSLILTGQNLDDEDLTNDDASIMINGAVVGTVEELDNGLIKVSYIDGTFEIF